MLDADKNEMQEQLAAIKNDAEMDVRSVCEYLTSLRFDTPTLR